MCTASFLMSLAFSMKRIDRYTKSEKEREIVRERMRNEKNAFNEIRLNGMWHAK